MMVSFASRPRLAASASLVLLVACTAAQPDTSSVAGSRDRGVRVGVPRPTADSSASGSADAARGTRSADPPVEQRVGRGTSPDPRADLAIEARIGDYAFRVTVVHTFSDGHKKKSRGVEILRVRPAESPLRQVWYRTGGPRYGTIRSHQTVEWSRGSARVLLERSRQRHDDGTTSELNCTYDPPMRLWPIPLRTGATFEQRTTCEDGRVFTQSVRVAASETIEIDSQRIKTFVVERAVRTEFDSPTGALQSTGMISFREWISSRLLIPVAWEQRNGDYAEYSGRLSKLP